MSLKCQSHFLLAQVLYTLNAFEYSMLITVVGIFGGAIISAVRQVAEHYSPAERKHPDAHHIQLQFLRLIVPGEVSISLQDVSVSRSASIIKLAVSQEEKECVVGYVKYVVMPVRTSSPAYLSLDLSIERGRASSEI